MPDAVATAAALGSRLWFTVADVLTVILVLYILTLAGVKPNPDKPELNIED